MFTEIVKKSYAKINLFLEVLGKRSDGYHELETIFQEVSLHDDIIIRIDSSKSRAISLECSSLNILPERNLGYRAAELFLEKFNIDDHIYIKIHKNIPSGAGLGGGSSNAGAVLIALANYYQIDPVSSEIKKIALSLGADVPFFLEGGCALGRGVGELLTPMEVKPMIFVLIFQSVVVPTASVYKALKMRLTEGSNHDIKSDVFFRGDLQSVTGRFFNRLEEVTFNLFPELKNIKSLLLELPSYGALMSGSGSAFFFRCFK